MTHFGKRGIYSGIRFASQLEARHAIFFDLLGVRWQYEPNNANFFCGGVEYKPDFYLPEQRVWLEVKGAGKSDWLDRAMSKASALAAFSGQHVFVSINVIPRPDKVLSDRWNMLHFAGITDACLASWSVCLRCGRYFCYSSASPQCPFCGRGMVTNAGRSHASGVLNWIVPIRRPMPGGNCCRNW